MSLLRRRSKDSNPGPSPVLVGISDTTVALAWQSEHKDEERRAILENQVKRGWKCERCSNINKTLTIGCMFCQLPRPLLELVNDNKVPTEQFVWQVRYRNPEKSSKKTWACTPPLKVKYAAIQFLKPGTSYEFSVRVARLPPGPDAVIQESHWSASSIPVTVLTLTTDHQVRLMNLARLNQFLDQNQKLEPFPEDVEKDSMLAKAARTTEGMLKVAQWAGVGGKWVNLARNAWNFKRSGIATLIFRKEVQQIVGAVSAFVGDVGKGAGLSAQDITIGSYYMLWERKRERLVHPDVEKDQHNTGLPGVLEEQAPASLVEELAWFSGLAHLSYRSTSARVQWVLHHFPSRNADSFQLVMSNPNARPSKPAYALVAHKAHKLAVLSIRGTREVDDVVTDTLYDATPAPFMFHNGSSQDGNVPEIGPRLSVHKGMLHSAMYLVDGRCTADSGLSKKSSKPRHGEPSQESQGAGIGAAIDALSEAGYRVVFCGHSLGAGVATLAALLLCDRNPELKVKVYGFGSPACVDERLAEACKGELRAQYPGTPGTELLPGLGNRVTVKNFINRDDLVPRLSVSNAKQFVADLKVSRSRWEPLLRNDMAAFTKRAKTLWAPPKRTRNVVNPSTVSNRLMPKVAAAPETKEEANSIGLVPPGIIVHSYRYRGTDQASLVDYRFEGLHRIEALPNMVDDHRQSAVLEVIRNLRVVRQAVANGNHPPTWQSIPIPRTSQDANGDTRLTEESSLEEFSTCVICKFFVGWNHTGDSETVEIRGTNHCYACGSIVCDACAKTRRSLPEIGILQCVRVCDDCNYKLSITGPANVGSDGLDIGSVFMNS